jgi:hypothetical protein
MSVKRFGPILGAGVQIEETEGDQQIIPAPYGVTVMVGDFERGEPGIPAFLSGKLDFSRRNGGRIQDSDAPTAALDFFKLSRGSGNLISYRVTGGDEAPAEVSLYTRQGTAAAPASGRKLLGKLYAKNGGKWGGQRKSHLDDVTGSGDLTATTIDTGDTMVENEWAGGTLQLKKVTTKTYTIVGNTAAGVVSVEADQDLLADWTAGAGTPANRYLLTRENVDHLGNDKHLAVQIGNGEENPSTEFSLKIYVDGALVGKGYNNLSTNPTKSNYWVKIINDDPSNREIRAVDLYTGDKTLAAVRPSNFYGTSKTLTALTLTLPDPDVTVDSPTSANPTVSFTRGSLVKHQVLVGTVENAGADMRWTSDIGPLEVLQAAFTGVATNLGDEIGSVTVTNGGTILADGDTINIEVTALVLNELKGGTVWPSVVAYPKLSFFIDSNTRTTVSVRTGLDLTNGGLISAGAPFMIQYQQEFELGNNSAPLSDADFLPAFDANLSTLRRIVGKNKGLVKITCPGVTSAVVQRAGVEFCAAMNWSYKVQIPSAYTVEADAIDYINGTIGRSEYASTHFPSFGSVSDPDATPGADDVPLKEQTLVGMILGREALVATQYDGYHKAPAGIDVTLPDVLELPTGNPDEQVALDEEALNPQGLNVVKFRQGTCITWGDRTLSPTSEWKWYHQRCQMSHYENLIRENFDWIVFAINNPTAWQRVSTSFRAFFLPEWTKGALRGKTFAEAMQLKVDEENNTDLTLSAGDLNAELTLKLAETVERFRVIIGKSGIFDAVE